MNYLSQNIVAFLANIDLKARQCLASISMCFSKLCDYFFGSNQVKSFSEKDHVNLKFLQAIFGSNREVKRPAHKHFSLFYSLLNLLIFPPKISQQRFVLLLITSSFFGLNLKAQQADIDLLRSINLGRNKANDPLWEALSYSVTPLAIGVSGGMIVTQLITKDSAQRYKTMYICGTVITAAAITTTLKYAVGRERPYVTYPDLDENTESTSPSFPSGHTSSAFALSTSLSVMYPKWYVVAPAYMWAGAVGYSRLALGAHYPSDVLAGAIIGSGSAWLSYKLNTWLNKKTKKQP